MSQIRQERSTHSRQGLSPIRRGEIEARLGRPRAKQAKKVRLGVAAPARAQVLTEAAQLIEEWVAKGYVRTAACAADLLRQRAALLAARATL